MAETFLTNSTAPATLSSNPAKLCGPPRGVLGLALLIGLCGLPVPAQATDYNEASCQQVAGTLNIHWEAIVGSAAPCTGIEIVDASLADAAAGFVELSGAGVTNVDCIGAYAYEFALSEDGTTLEGSDTFFEIPMTLTRGPGEDCFVGHWISGEDDYLAHLAVGPWATERCGDVNDNGKVQSSDALLVLKDAVGQDVDLQCVVCGDGEVGTDESCEIGNLDGRTCESLGFEGGELACTAGCNFDTSGCYLTRFDASGETILDHKTGLEWEKKRDADAVEDLDDPRDADNLYTWCAGAGSCASPGDPMDGSVTTDFLMRLNGGLGPGTCYAGHCDWRLPTVGELSSLPWPAVAAFLPDAANFHWTSSNDPANLPGGAFAVVTSDGGITSGGVKALGGFVRAVRGEP